MSKIPVAAGQWVRNSQLARYFNVSNMCIWRWKHDPELGTPPSPVVNNIEWNDLRAWDDWMHSRVVKHITTLSEKRSEKSDRAERFGKRRRQGERTRTSTKDAAAR